MPSRKELKAISDNAESKVRVAMYVAYIVYGARKSADHGSTSFVDSIHRNSPEYNLVHEILDALKLEFTDCRFELNTWPKYNSDGKNERLEHNDPNGCFREFIIYWDNE